MRDELKVVMTNAGPKPDIASYLKELIRKIEFLDSLLAMGEEPHEIEFEVHQAMKLGVESLVCWLIIYNEKLSKDDSVMAICALIEYVYMFSYPRRMTMAKVSKKMLKELLSGKGAKGPLRRTLCSPEGHRVITIFFFMLAEGGYPGVQRQLRHLKDLEKR